MEPLLKMKLTIEKLKKVINTQNVYRMEFDGCSKGNPGMSGVGFLLIEVDSEEVFRKFAIFVG